MLVGWVLERGSCVLVRGLKKDSLIFSGNTVHCDRTSGAADPGWPRRLGPIEAAPCRARGHRPVAHGAADTGWPRRLGPIDARGHRPVTHAAPFFPADHHRPTVFNSELAAAQGDDVLVLEGVVAAGLEDHLVDEDGVALRRVLDRHAAVRVRGQLGVIPGDTAQLDADVCGLAAVAGEVGWVGGRWMRRGACTNRMLS